MTEKLLSVEVDRLMPDPTQPRKQFIMDEINRLAASIATRGVLQPLRIAWDEERKSGRIITGESRWRAAKIAGLTHVPCVLVEGAVSETDILSDQIIENSVRHSLAPLDFARALVKLRALKKCTAQQLAGELGLAGASITRAEALLSLSAPIQAMVDDGRLSESAAYEISRHPDPAAQLELARLVAAKALSRDQVAEVVRERVGRKAVRSKGARVACRMDSGVCLTLSAAEPLTWDTLITALDAGRKLARKLCDAGKDVTTFGKGAPV
jgi:ParB family chromosome partitioning protein